MKSTFLFMFFLIAFTDTIAQEKDKETYLILTLAPLALIDIYDGASFRPGAEVSLRKNISFSIEGGPYFKYLRATKLEAQGYLIKPGIKYFFSKNKKYIALEYMYKNQDYEFIDKLVVDEIGQEMRYGMSRKVHSLNFKYGKIVSLGRNFILDWYFGIGVRNIKSDNDLTNDQQQFINSVENECTVQENLIRQTGNLFYPDFQVGLKLGCKVL